MSDENRIFPKHDPDAKHETYNPSHQMHDVVVLLAEAKGLHQIIKSVLEGGVQSEEAARMCAVISAELSACCGEFIRPVFDWTEKKLKGGE